MSKRPITPESDTKTRNTRKKARLAPLSAGVVDEETKNKLEKWRLAIWERDYNDAPGDKAEILSDDMIKVLASGGPLTRNEVMEIFRSHYHWGRHSPELVEFLTEATAGTCPSRKITEDASSALEEAQLEESIERAGELVAQLEEIAEHLEWAAKHADRAYLRTLLKRVSALGVDRLVADIKHFEATGWQPNPPRTRREQEYFNNTFGYIPRKTNSVSASASSLGKQ